MFVHPLKLHLPSPEPRKLPSSLHTSAEPIATTRQVLWAKLPRCRKPIGLVLMDQSMMAGVGNIYRAEILFKAGVHPETPASAISREQFDKIW